MEYLIVILLLVLTGLVGYQMIRRSRNPDRLEALLGRNFLHFQENIQQSLHSTRQEFQQSKDLMSGSALKTMETLKDMGHTIESLVSQQKEAQELGKSLKQLLQPPKTRGSYGEAVLEEMLDRVLPKGIWERQYAIDGKERVDAVVKFKDTIVPIDSKFPKDAYDRYLATDDPDEQKVHWKAYEDATKRQIKSIAEKYIKPDLGTTEFALMFIPSETIYYETIAENNHLGEPSTLSDYAQKYHVMPVSPNTFYAFLQIIILSIRNVSILENARELQTGLKKLERNFDLFYKKYQEVGKGVEKASEAYRVGEGHIERFREDLTSTISLELPDKPADQIEDSAPD